MFKKKKKLGSSKNLITSHFSPKIRDYSKHTFQLTIIIICSSCDIPIVTPWTKNTIQNMKMKKIRLPCFENTMRFQPYSSIFSHNMCQVYILKVCLEEYISLPKEKVTSDFFPSRKTKKNMTFRTHRHISTCAYLWKLT